MNYAFEDRENLYLVIDLMQGGDLRYHLAKHKKFNEEQTRFFIACMLQALEYLHQKSILHRDIKPGTLNAVTIMPYPIFFIQYYLYHYLLFMNLNIIFHLFVYVLTARTHRK